MTYSELQDKIADWAIVNCGLVTDPVTARTIYNKAESARSASEQEIFEAMNNVVLWMAENGPRPNRTYMTLHLFNINTPGLPYKSVATEHGTTPNFTYTQQIKFPEDVTVEIQFYGKGVENNAQTLRRSLMLETPLSDLRIAGLVVRKDTPVRDAHTPIDKTYEERVVYEVTFGIGHDVTESIDAITTVATIQQDIDY